MSCQCVFHDHCIAWCASWAYVTTNPSVRKLVKCYHIGQWRVYRKLNFIGQSLQNSLDLFFKHYGQLTREFIFSGTIYRAMSSRDRLGGDELWRYHSEPTWKAAGTQWRFTTVSWKNACWGIPRKSGSDRILEHCETPTSRFRSDGTIKRRFLNSKKRVIRIITHSRTRDSCRELFKRLEILPLYSQYIFSVDVYIKQHLFTTNSQIHRVHTRFKTTLHPPTANLTKFQKGVYYSGIKICNNLPHEIKDLANEIIQFQKALKRFLLMNCFYNSEEYFN
jgi:hypothetical protein